MEPALARELDHEVRTHVNVIVGYLAVLADDTGALGSTPRTDCVACICAAGDALMIALRKIDSPAED